MNRRYGIVGHSRSIDAVIRRIELVATTRSTVLITGETGTGKELVARAVHIGGVQPNQPFVKINCSAIPEALLESELFGHVKGAFTGAVSARRGKFALANRGSIFLDEIGTMSGGLQAKLLRVLQERELEPLGAERPEQVDVRVIAATNADLRRLVQQDRFRDDLYYRLNVVPIVVPPLRERVGDIPLLAHHFVHKHAERTGKHVHSIDNDALCLLETYHWPGNVRELENAIERAVILTNGPMLTREVVTLECMGGAQPSTIPSLQLEQNIQWVERETIRRALELSSAKNQAAKLMGISPRALSYYLAKYPSLDAHGTTATDRALS